MPRYLLIALILLAPAARADDFAGGDTAKKLDEIQSQAKGLAAKNETRHARPFIDVMPVPLTTMRHVADSIFLGTVISTGLVQNSKFPLLSTVVEVSTAVRGPAGKIELRQVEDFASPFAVGHEVLLFVAKPSSLGTTAPIGLDSGFFTVMEQGGRKVLMSNNGNARLLEGIKLTPAQLKAIEARTSPAAAADLDRQLKEYQKPGGFSEPIPLDSFLALLDVLEAADHNVVKLGTADNGKSVDAKPGQSIDLVFVVRPGTGYGWSLAGAAPAGLTLEPGYPQTVGDPSLEGGKALQTFRFKAGGAGSQSLTLEYKRGTNEAPAQTFSVTINVK
jgi:predicted secreted protein